jgi:hypothetical protein
MKLGLFPERKSCYCAFCKTPRKVYRNKNLNLMTMVGLIGLSFVLTNTIWHNFDPRGLFILGLLLISGEVLAQIKWRQSMICQNCGFDAVLYIRDPEKAGLKIKEFLDYRAGRPEYLLRPPVKIPQRKQSLSPVNKVDTQLNSRIQNRGQNISLRG